MKIGVSVRKSGRIWTPAALASPEKQAIKGINEAGEYLAAELRRASPTATGQLRGATRAIGTGLGRRVVAGTAYSVPLESGSVSGFRKIAPLAAWASVKLGLSGGSARRFAFALSKTRSRTPQKPVQYFYRTFDRIAPLLDRQFLSPIGLAIVRELEQ